MSNAKYVRKDDKAKGYEYGFIEITDTGSSKEKRNHIKVGTAPTYEEALLLNDMAVSGARQQGHSFLAPWRELGRN